jgi:hypothetical protein
MTTVFERTRSVIEAGIFLGQLSRNESLPGKIREQAKQLLRHYPTAEAIRLAGRCEAIRQDEISKLPSSSNTLHPALATWPLLDPFFCDPTDRDAPTLNSLPALNASPELQSIPGAVGKIPDVGFQVLGLAVPSGISCLGIKHRCFVSARAQVLARATVVLGSPTRASNWFVSRILSLDGQQPCTLLLNVNEFALVMDVLTRLEHGIF